MEQGVCPKCKSEELVYDSMEYLGDSIYYPVTCNDCGWVGKEWYALDFIEMTNDTFDINDKP